MLAFTWWDSFAVVGVVALVLFAWWLIAEICMGIYSKRRANLEKFCKALRVAQSEQLDTAASILTMEGIHYLRDLDSSHPCKWRFPRFFWKQELSREKARAIVTMINYEKEVQGDPVRSNVLDLVLLLFKQARKTPKAVLALVAELARLTNDTPIGKEFISRLNDE